MGDDFHSSSGIKLIFLNNNMMYKQEGNDILLNFTQPKSGDQIATIETSMGNIKLMFFIEVAPKAVENFTTMLKTVTTIQLFFIELSTDL